MSEVNLREIAKHFEEKLSKIKCCLFDVDGILTDGSIFFLNEEIGFNRSFNVRDGYGLKILEEFGITTGIISGGTSECVIMRFKQLGVHEIFTGKMDKRKAYLEIQKKYQLKDEEILYMGDEFFDMPLLKKCGFAATSPHSSHEIKEVCDYVTLTPAGKGCVREVIDMLRYVQGLTPEVEDFE